MANRLEKIKYFWEDHINNEYYTDSSRESAEYFVEIEKKRYKYHYHLHELFQRIAMRNIQGKVLLDVGCGIGIDTVQFARMGFERVVGVDLTQTAIDIALGIKK